jgi:hypothetical protein
MLRSGLQLARSSAANWGGRRALGRARLPQLWTTTLLGPPPSQAILPGLALGARSRPSVEAVIGFAVPGRPIGLCSRRTGAPMASATGRDRSPRSALGPLRTGITGARMVTSGHQRRSGTSGRPAFKSGSSRNASGPDQIVAPKVAGWSRFLCHAQLAPGADRMRSMTLISRSASALKRP